MSNAGVDSCQRNSDLIRDREGVGKDGEDDDPGGPVEEVAGEAKGPDADQDGDLLADADEAEHGRDGDQGVDNDVQHSKHQDLVVEVLHGVLPDVKAEDGHRVPEKEDKNENTKETSLYFSSTPSTSSALSTAHCLLLMM